MIRLRREKILIIAVATMMIDHLGVIFLPENEALRLIGRLSFPMFAMLLASGYKLSRDRGKYLNRILIFAGISQIPYMAALGKENLNIFFSLANGLLMLEALNAENKQKGTLCLMMTAALSLLTDYGIYGLACFAIMAAKPKMKRKYWWITWIAINLLKPTQIGAMAAGAAEIEPGEKRIKGKWHYWIYPIHLSLFAITKQLM